jgi:hypothetical protein
MLKALLISTVFLLGLVSAGLNGVYASTSPSVDNEQQSESPYAGRYEGEWIAAPTTSGRYSDGETEHKGTWDISIASDGEITGTESDKSGGTKGKLSGFIDEDGYVKLFLKDSEANNTIKGTLEKRGIRLTGKLKIYCSNGNLCGNLEIILKRK